MIKKYEDACRQAGLSEEQIKKIRQVFDDEKKRLKRETIEKAKNHIWFIPISELQNTANGWNRSRRFRMRIPT